MVAKFSLLIYLILSSTDQIYSYITYNNDDYLILINEVKQNTLAYIPRVRYNNEVDDCDIILHDTNLFTEDNINVILNDNSNETMIQRTKISRRTSFFRTHLHQLGASVHRWRELYLETTLRNINHFKNGKN